MQKSSRYHHLDALRAIMMILGIVIHSALSYCVFDHKLVWVVSDEFSENVGFDALSDLIHFFRMPIFFIVAGFFAAMLYFERGAKAMLRNRVKRVLLPMIVAFIIIIPIAIYAFTFSVNAIKLALGETVVIDYSIFNVITKDTLSWIHLWFLYYLMLFCIVAWLVTSMIEKYSVSTINTIRNFFQYLFRNNIIIFINIVLTITALLIAQKTVVEASMAFKPDFITFYTHLIYFTFGWFLYHQREYLYKFKKHYKRYLLIGFILCLIRWTIPEVIENHNVGSFFYLKIVISATIIWTFVYGIIGLFIQYFEKQSVRMRYLSDASYWIYLVHLPLTAFLPGLCVTWNVPTIVKFLFVVSTTTIITVVTYHFFVRSTFIGQFLNGKKYK